MKLMTERELNILRGKAMVGRTTPSDTLAVLDHLALLESELDKCENEMHECIRTSKAAYAVVHTLRARLAAVEAERDMLNGALEAAPDAGILSRTIDNLAAERDRLKAALQGLQSDIEHDAHVNQPEAFRNYWRGRLHSEIAALTPQGQSTDGETK